MTIVEIIARNPTLVSNSIIAAVAMIIVLLIATSARRKSAGAPEEHRRKAPAKERSVIQSSLTLGMRRFSSWWGTIDWDTAPSWIWIVSGIAIAIPISIMAIWSGWFG